MSPAHHFAGPLIVCEGDRALEVVRCRRYLPGTHEDAGGDGAAQLRLPLGEWIVGLRESATASR